ncbi:glycoside hydrolase family 95 protein [Auricularia subglabra TFB-10046 SS5]|nr:glycoside hydrolase family 95 protein [Auricularia subglabra TFB-10046 SS5]
MADARTGPQGGPGEKAADNSACRATQLPRQLSSRANPWSMRALLLTWLAIVLTALLAMQAVRMTGSSVPYKAPWLSPASAPLVTPGNRLWYKSWGTDWYHSYLPVGNGYMGMMQSSRPDFDDVVLNLESLWTGGPYNSANNYNGGNPLTAVNASVRENIRATIWANGSPDLTPLVDGSHYGSLSSPGSLHISRSIGNDVTGYERALDFNDGTISATWKEGSNSYLRTYFCSFPDQVCVVNTEGTGNDTAIYSLDTLRPRDYASVACLDKSTLAYRGLAESSGMTYEILVRLISSSPDSVTCSGAGNATLTGSGARQMVLITGATNYNIDAGTRAHNFSFAGPDPHASALNSLSKASRSSYEALLSRHIDDYSALFHGFELDLGQKPDVVKPTDQLVAEYVTGTGNVYLEWLLFNLGRFMMITGARGVLPSGLQSVWTTGLEAPWGGDYHANINLQMNYWGAEETNLGAVTGPLWNYMRKTWVPRGSETAQLVYGSRGFVVHNEMNIFGHTGMKLGDPQWADYPAAATWMMLHVWDHFDFTGDLNWFRSQGWSLLKAQAEFWLDNLFEDSASKDGTLVAVPCNSPENGIVGPTYGCAHFQQLIWELFHNIQKGFKLSGDADQSFLKEIEAKLSKLDRGVRIGSWGQMQEWKRDLDQPGDLHRHISHLMGLYPGYAVASWNEPSPSRQEVMKAAATTVAHRGPGIADSDAGWEKMVRSVLWSQLGNASGAYYAYQLSLERDYGANLFDMYSGEANSLFQIDANFGAVGAVINMIVQATNTPSLSDPLVINLLPALPGAWSTGSVKNARVRNGIGLSMSWSAGTVKSVILHFDKPGQRKEIQVTSKGQILRRLTGPMPATVRVV